MLIKKYDSELTYTEKYRDNIEEHNKQTMFLRKDSTVDSEIKLKMLHT